MVNKNDESSMFKLADSVSERKQVEIFEGVDILEDSHSKKSEVDEIPDYVIDNIKGKTLQKLNLTQTATGTTLLLPSINAKKRSVIWKPAIAAACILALLLTSFNFKTVVAEVRKLLVFIPGINRVIDKNNENVYVLPKPVKIQHGQGEMTVTGVSADSKTISISIWGKDTAVPSKVFFIDRGGNEYEASTHNSWGGGRWQGSYYYRGSIGDMSELRVLMKDLGDLVIPLKLELAKEYESYNELGSTDIKNNVSITVVPEIEQDKLKINLLAQIEEGARLVSFGDYGKKLKLTDSSGKEYELWRPDTGFLSRDVYYFDTKGMNEKPYMLTIPYLEIAMYDQKKSRNTAKIDIPKEGNLIIDMEVELAGFPVVIKAVERLDSKSIRIYVDVKYNKSSERSLKQVNIGNISTKVLGANLLAEQFKKNGAAIGPNSDRIELSHSMRFNEVTEEAEFFEIGIEQDAESIILLMHDPLIEVRGTWVFEVNP